MGKEAFDNWKPCGTCASKNCFTCQWNNSFWREPCRSCWPDFGGYKPRNFCPMCGRPLTDEAVEITLRRLEALHENNR